MGHYKNWTGDTGGYMDEVTGIFYDKDHNVTTKALAFPNDVLRIYSIRKRVYLRRSGARNWSDCIALAHTETKAGETGWFVWNRAEFEYIVSYNINIPAYLDSRLFNFSAFDMWCSTTDKTDSTKAWRLTTGINNWSLALKTISASNAYIKNF